MASQYTYRYYCTTTSTWLVEKLETDPTYCKHEDGLEHTHSITNIHIIGSNEKHKTIMNEDYATTNGNFRIYGYDIAIAASSETVYDTTAFPHDICIFGIKVYPTAGNIGDSFDFFSGVDTTIGTITSTVAISDTVINVSPSVIANIRVGFMVKLVSEDSNDLGVCEFVGTSTITVTTAATSSFSTGTIKITVPKGTGMKIVNDRTMIIGDLVANGTVLPKGVLGRLIYHNANSLPKTLHFQFVTTM